MRWPPWGSLHWRVSSAVEEHVGVSRHHLAFIHCGDGAVIEEPPSCERGQGRDKHTKLCDPLMRPHCLILTCPSLLQEGKHSLQVSHASGMSYPVHSPKFSPQPTNAVGSHSLALLPNVHSWVLLPWQRLADLWGILQRCQDTPELTESDEAGKWDPVTM